MRDPVTLSSGRLRLRPWDDADRAAFAAMNADARVMEFFPKPLSRTESDAMIDFIARHFGEHGFGFWAVEVPQVAPFIGFTGLASIRHPASHVPCVEVGWRLAVAHWGQGYATEAARLALDYGFGTLALPEIIAYTAATNRRSRAVMERLGMHRDLADDFAHPAIPPDHPLCRHVLYRLSSASYSAG